jgi:hypothetical protein
MMLTGETEWLGTNPCPSAPSTTLSIKIPQGNLSPKPGPRYDKVTTELRHGQTVCYPRCWYESCITSMNNKDGINMAHTISLRNFNAATVNQRTTYAC